LTVSGFRVPVSGRSKEVDAHREGAKGAKKKTLYVLGVLGVFAVNLILISWYQIGMVRLREIGA